MPRYKLTIEYDGAPYMGWQWQNHGPSVQGVLENAGKKLNRNEPVEVYGSGRTDSGVHALGQIAHMDLKKEYRTDKIRDAMNFHMADDPVTILKAEMVPDEWHARFDATEREYLYRVIDRRMKLSLDKGRLWRIPVKLNVELMHKAAQHLVGQHDFTTFRDTQCQAKSPTKTIDRITIAREEKEIHFYFRARSFLHKQVRSMVGTLVEVGLEKLNPESIKEILESRDRTKCGPVAPPDGLYLKSVKY
ncbi:MAG: tRNA pseudouridine(38-40) synthase TruA [Hellea sp.]|jgi:tRNA pseudouridine38-40 synthase